MSAAPKSVIKRGGLVLTSTLLSFLLIELVYRVAMPPAPGGGGDDEWTNRYRHMNETIYQRSSVPGLIYEPRPESRVEMEYGIAGFGPQGRRWDGRASEETVDRTEIAMVGDSLVWSEFVSFEDSLPHQVEAYLGAEGYRVSNFGVSGYDTGEEAIYYRRRVAHFAPRIAVVVFCLNDFFIASGPRGRFATEAESAQKDEQDRFFDAVAPLRRETLDGRLAYRRSEAISKVWAALHGWWDRAAFARHYVDEYTIAVGDEGHRQRLRHSLRELSRAIGNRPLRRLLFISPILESWDEYRWSALHSYVRQVAEETGFEVYDPLDEWGESERPESLRSPGDNLHYSPEGNRLFARYIGRRVRSH